MVDSNKTVLVVTPHPDDAEGGAGGTIVKWANEGNKIVLLVCTNGDKGTSDASMPSDKLAEIREKEQLNAAKALGVSEVVFLREPDQGLDDNDRFREKVVRRFGSTSRRSSLPSTPTGLTFDTEIITTAEE
jgi:LmbE family N-acetylglucosaminyl deacetylase